MCSFWFTLPMNTLHLVVMSPPSPRVCDSFSIFAYFHNLDSLGKYCTGLVSCRMPPYLSFSVPFFCVIRLELLVFGKDAAYVKRPSCHMMWQGGVWCPHDVTRDVNLHHLVEMLLISQASALQSYYFPHYQLHYCEVRL